MWDSVKFASLDRELPVRERIQRFPGVLVETAFLVCAGAGGTVLVCQFLLGVLGLGADHDIDHDHDVGHDNDHSSSLNWFAGLITLRSVTSGLTFFGLAGMTALYSGANQVMAFSAALAGGGLALAIVAQIMKGLKKLKSDGAVRIERTIGVDAVVYLAVPPNDEGPGKVTVVVQKRTMEYTAFTKHPTALPTGSRVRVTAVRGPSSVEVEPVETAA